MGNLILYNDRNSFIEFNINEYAEGELRLVLTDSNGKGIIINGTILENKLKFNIPPFPYTGNITGKLELINENVYNILWHDSIEIVNKTTVNETKILYNTSKINESVNQNLHKITSSVEMISELNALINKYK